MATKAKSFSSVLTLPQPKKHSVRFDAMDDTKDPICSSIYISNATYEGLGNPGSIKVTVEAA